MAKNILIIHPYDKTTTFLERIKNYLQYSFSENLHYYNIKTNKGSHKYCLDIIQKFSPNGFILYMGHGKSNCLYGAIGDYCEAFTDNEAKIENPEEYFSNTDFINLENVKVFNNKKVICLTCNSNSQIGRRALENGVKVFVGFGDLPTSTGELKEQGEENRLGVSLKMIEKALKSEINYIIKKSIQIAVEKDYTFRELVDLIHFITNQRINYYLVDQKKVKERKLIANYLYTFKKEIKIYGNGNEKLVG